MKALSLIVGFALTGAVGAENATLTWTNAATNVDGTPIVATGPGSLTRTTVEYGTCAANHAFGVKAGEVFVAAPATTLVVNMVVVQEYCFRAFHTNTYGAVSAPSNVAWKANPPPLPGPPGNLAVQTDTTAYGLVITRDRVALVPVGNVAPGTMCDPAQPVLDKFVVPRASVTFADSVRPQAVVAACG